MARRKTTKRTKRRRRAKPESRGQPLPPPLPEPDAETVRYAVEALDGTGLDGLARTAVASLAMMAPLVGAGEADVLGQVAAAVDKMPSVIEARGFVRGYDAAMAALRRQAACRRQETERPMKRRLGLLLSLHVPELPRGYTVVEAEPCLNLPDEDGLTQPLAMVTVGIEVPGRPGVLRLTAANLADLRQQIAEALASEEPG